MKYNYRGSIFDTKGRMRKGTGICPKANAMQMKLDTSSQPFSTVFAVHNQISTNLKYYFKPIFWTGSFSVT